MTETWRASFSWRQRSSESRKATSGERDSATPRFRAAATPRLSWRTTRTLSSARASMASEVPSVEPSSMTIHSHSPKVCAWTEATASAAMARRLKVGMMTLTAGSKVSPP